MDEAPKLNGEMATESMLVLFTADLSLYDELILVGAIIVVIQ